MRISDWSSDVCSSDLGRRVRRLSEPEGLCQPWRRVHPLSVRPDRDVCGPDQRRSLQKAAARISQELLFRYVDPRTGCPEIRSEEHKSELQSLMSNSYAVFCLKKTKKNTNRRPHHRHRHNSPKL